VKIDAYKNRNLKDSGYERQLWTCFRYEICQETEVYTTLSCRVWPQSVAQQAVAQIYLTVYGVLNVKYFKHVISTFHDHIPSYAS
jgi:hypothetical protein